MAWLLQLCHENCQVVAADRSFRHGCLLTLSLSARFIPFSGGPRKCVGDQFALLEAIVALAIFLQHMEFELVADQKISMTTGATIHTTNVRT